jgi:hypothetical protein
VGPVLDMVAVSCDLEGALSEELGWRIKLVFTTPFYSTCRAQPFASSIVTPWVYIAGGRSYA